MNSEKSVNIKQIIQALEELTKEAGFIYSLAIMLRHNFFFDPEEVADINWHERISIQEASFLVGLMVKHKVNLTILPTEEIVSKQIVCIYDLFKSLQKAHNKPFTDRLAKLMEKSVPSFHLPLTIP